MPTETPLQRLASNLLGEPIGPWIRARRPARKTWRQIAAELRETTKGEINIPIQTLINWSPDPADEDDLLDEQAS